MEIQIIVYSLTFLFLLLAVSIYKGYSYQIKQRFSSQLKPCLSLIIAARNEEENIPLLFESLEKLKYPVENFEVILVDDNSSDRTNELIKVTIKTKTNYNLIKADAKKIEGKKGALQVGIENAKYNFIVITDADCRPEVDWLKEIAGKLDAGFDFVSGIAPIKSGKLFVQKLAAFENLRNTYLTISAVGLNVPYSAAARSFAFRKNSFEKIGGYAGTTETISGDDDLLLREAVKNKMLIGTVIGPETFVYSDPPSSFNNYFRQKKRHLKTSFYYLPKQKLFLGLWHSINLMSLFSILLVPVSLNFIFPFAVKLIYDFYAVIKHQSELGHHFNFLLIIPMQIAFELFIIINFFNSLIGKPEWK
ncbi:MAG: glycosyltransferase [Ignavibacteriaceae bacterium]|jgi:cellulose synthase/poly-beta-1,6-N-acetylglucosamine synthase-like glycosyltransferase|nr:glycosyltransferase [Ignavibacteriaceae bacterium]